MFHDGITIKFDMNGTNKPLGKTSTGKKYA